MGRRVQEREGTVCARLRLVLSYSCPECGGDVDYVVSTKRHWIFDAPAASEVCPHCHAGLEVLRPDSETLPDALEMLSQSLDEPEEESDHV